MKSTWEIEMGGGFVGLVLVDEKMLKICMN